MTHDDEPCPQVHRRDEPSIDRLWGCGNLGELFGPAPRTPTPWARGGKDRRGPTFDQAAVKDLLTKPVGLVDVDPRTVRCSQPWLVREHVAYYLTGRWEVSGRTSADQHLELNRFPVIVQDRRGLHVILSGHHRTAAALLEGRPFRARIIAPGSSFYVTPRLVVDPDATLASDPTATIVNSLDEARTALARLGVGAGDAAMAIETAARRLPHEGGDPHGRASAR